MKENLVNIKQRATSIVDNIEKEKQKKEELEKTKQRKLADERVQQRILTITSSLEQKILDEANKGERQLVVVMANRKDSEEQRVLEAVYKYCQDNGLDPQQKYTPSTDDPDYSIPEHDSVIINW